MGGVIGVCGPTNVRTPESKAIDAQLKKDNKLHNTTSRVLVLGAAGSGKSTIIKQVVSMHGGFSQSDVGTYKDIIRTNIVAGFKRLLAEAKKMELKVVHKRKEAMVAVLDAKLYGGLTETDIRSCKALWEDPVIKRVFQACRAQSLETQNLQYFLDTVIDKMLSDYAAWTPNDEDIVRARQRTSGINTTGFKHIGRYWLMVDVGGQKNERRKWIHAFENTHTIMFTTATNEWNIPCDEVAGNTKMATSIQIWDENINSHYLQDAVVVLFLNKIDLLEQTLKKGKFKETYPDFEGEQTMKTVLEYIKNKYLELVLPARGEKREVIVHNVSAINKSQIISVLHEVLYAVLNSCGGLLL